ncbi:MAG: SH3 domain-containing protein [Lentisphaeria bacterium]|nr:SH3 domain-containing protein [Candidatus Neomarinimicrobiota bacterium]MCF7842924.1 SH3 domain-containing protein [Lentisphaeria bacterium]
MLRKIYPLFAVAILLNAIVIGADLQRLMDDADAAYTSGNFPKAVSLYSQILKSGYTSAVLEYNLGSAYFKIDSIGAAILHLERARRLAPRDEDILFNLEYAKVHRKDELALPGKSALVNMFESLRNYFTLNELSWTLLFLWLVVVSTFMVYWFRRGIRGGKVWLYLFLTSSLVFILSAGWVADRYRLDSREQIIVMVDEVQVHSAPVETSKVLFILREGMEGTVRERTEGWYEIKLADGKTGWIPTHAIASI